MDQEQDNLSEWMDQPSESMTMEQMDILVQDLRAKRAQYEQAKEASKKIYADLEEAENKVLGALKAAGKRKYEVDGVGLVYTTVKDTFATPKSNEDKTKVFNYIKEKYGPDVLMSMVGINHQTLNSWAGKEIEADPLLQIPGLAAPTSEEILCFRKK